jgi:hypothetical protein
MFRRGGHVPRIQSPVELVHFARNSHERREKTFRMRVPRSNRFKIEIEIDYRRERANRYERGQSTHAEEDLSCQNATSTN